MHAMLDLEPAGPVVDPFDVPGGWRVGEPAVTTWRMSVSGHEPVAVRVRGRATGADVVVGDAAAMRCSARRSGQELTVTVDGTMVRYVCAQDGETLWLGRDGQAWAVREQAQLDAAAAEAADAGGPVLSPMPGTVTVVAVTEGQRVTAGERLVVVEAMKMEHALTAPIDGVVRELRARAGGTVAKDAVLAVVEPED
jgi:acetyl-CoA/propionyl-CoA carboxylase biotin carboxyl carrier protein